MFFVVDNRRVANLQDRLMPFDGRFMLKIKCLCSVLASFP